MSPMQDANLSASTLQRIRGLSRPVAILLSIALGLVLVVQTLEIAALLFGFHKGDDWQALASFSDTGFGLFVFQDSRPAQQLGTVAVETLDLNQRIGVAALAAICAGCAAMALLNLRRLFGLYSSGAVFSPQSGERMKRFALWLVLTALAINISGRAFVALTGAAATAPANVVMTVLCGAMVYVIARVMELACEADKERREFV